MTTVNREKLREKAERIRFLLLDVDGVMTDGRIWLDSHGGEMKAFYMTMGEHDMVTVIEAPNDEAYAKTIPFVLESSVLQAA